MDDLKAHFKAQSIPIELKVVQGRSRKLYLVFAYPYSGVDTTDFACYIEYPAGLVLLASGYLAATTPTAEVKVDGDFVDVLSHGKVALKISLDPPGR